MPVAGYSLGRYFVTKLEDRAVVSYSFNREAVAVAYKTYLDLDAEDVQHFYNVLFDMSERVAVSPEEGRQVYAAEKALLEYPAKNSYIAGALNDAFMRAIISAAANKRRGVYPVSRRRHDTETYVPRTRLAVA